MQPGLTYLWIAGVALSALCRFYLKIIRIRGGKFVNRRRLNGYETARQALDHLEFNRMTVDRRILPEKISKGMSLGDLAFTLNAVFRYAENSKSPIPESLRIPSGRWFRAAVGVSWLLVAAGLLSFSPAGVMRTGQLLWTALFIVSLSLVWEEKERLQKAAAYLSHMDALTTDEKIKIRAILRAYRWEVLAGLWPFGI